ncbi:MAG TPA: glycosyltransferase [Plantibacter sp.]|uniref:glycosyltransferase family 2 protein n=1 Tax=unclassified Plantibacter TaxID=2624265 RepID=UPI002C73BBF5|nr:glycosyltransferase [Plantibacter sp.]
MISVVIPCRNGAPALGAQLDALMAQQTSSPFEIVVADNRSTDGTVALVGAYSARDHRVRLVDASQVAGINHGRNTGVRASRGDIVLLCDADDVVQPGWIDAHARAFAAGAVCVGGGVDRVLADGTVLERQRRLSTVHWDVPSPVGANCGFLRDVFDHIGGFDETFRGGGDETDFFWRAASAGFPTVAVPDAVVAYALREDLRGVARQFYAYGTGTVRLFRAHAAHGMPRSPWWTAPFVILVGALQLTVRGHRRQGVERLSSRAGRLVESVRSRTFYL